MNDLHGNWGFDMGISMTIFWLVVIGFIFILVKKGIEVPSDQSEIAPETPLKILQKRYASGEINQNEFESMKKELEKES